MLNTKGIGIMLDKIKYLLSMARHEDFVLLPKKKLIDWSFYCDELSEEEREKFLNMMIKAYETP